MAKTDFELQKENGLKIAKSRIEEIQVKHYETIGSTIYVKADRATVENILELIANLDYYIENK
jgi:hypothetical protein